jgi:hypothetical protein
VFGHPICTPVLSTKQKRINPNCLITQLLCNFPNFQSSVKKVGLPLFFFSWKKTKRLPSLSLSLSLAIHQPTNELAWKKNSIRNGLVAINKIKLDYEHHEDKGNDTFIEYFPLTVNFLTSKIFYVECNRGPFERLVVHKGCNCIF